MASVCGHVGKEKAHVTSRSPGSLSSIFASHNKTVRSSEKEHTGSVQNTNHKASHSNRVLLPPPYTLHPSTPAPLEEETSPSEDTVPGEWGGERRSPSSTSDRLVTPCLDGPVT